ncbi:MAG: hypothetical protein G01um101448_613 [Parcubacteria group bacterium Gr01-1014_48]|nr:MAG: hypothetical protein Greene041614_459 [Parcubacteria group bacterium Greene0416_14]TSC73724.1 MAG: hypothetical protein G01um101448_613 [Parcubacteria group bacterium Gr01-1014_48]TSD00993.1 MAG: hypothetical protein Greene101415_566 [Parcubacteria group bacterium Greene1014_15]TSD08111.1 MAG: hypothetical protein Greene07144_395 [Parcubacteria group bacterium Greene0714_4]
MKIQGVLSVEGINLHVQIDAGDEAKDVFVTNLPPHALVFTRERLRIEALGFSQEIVDTLLRQRIFHLNDLVNEYWEFTLENVPSEVRADVEKTLELFLDAALIPFSEEIPEGLAAPEELKRSVAKLKELQEMLNSGAHSESLITEEIESGTIERETSVSVASNGVHNESISVLGLPAGVTRELQGALGVTALGDFGTKHVGRRELATLRYMNEKILARIEAGLLQHGLELPT